MTPDVWRWQLAGRVGLFVFVHCVCSSSPRQANLSTRPEALPRLQPRGNHVSVRSLTRGIFGRHISIESALLRIVYLGSETAHHAWLYAHGHGAVSLFPPCHVRRMEGIPVKQRFDDLRATATRVHGDTCVGFVIVFYVSYIVISWTSGSDGLVGGVLELARVPKLFEGDHLLQARHGPKGEPVDDIADRRGAFQAATDKGGVEEMSISFNKPSMSVSSGRL
jgi:hypothetical protein